MQTTFTRYTNKNKHLLIGAFFVFYFDTGENTHKATTFQFQKIFSYQKLKLIYFYFQIVHTKLFLTYF